MGQVGSSSGPGSRKQRLSGLGVIGPLPGSVRQVPPPSTCTCSPVHRVVPWPFPAGLYRPESCESTHPLPPAQLRRYEALRTRRDLGNRSPRLHTYVNTHELDTQLAFLRTFVAFQHAGETTAACRPEQRGGSRQGSDETCLREWQLPTLSTLDSAWYNDEMGHDGLTPMRPGGAVLFE